MTFAQVVPLVLIAGISFALSYVGSAVGLVLGQLRVVLLTYWLGSATLGASTSLAISTLATIAGAVTHARGGRVQVVPLLLIGVPSAVAAYCTTRLAVHVDPRLLKVGIAVALVGAGAMLLQKGTRDDEPAVDSAGPLEAPARRAAAQLVVGLFLGALSGLVGLLLGTLRLPAMLRVGGMSARSAVGTNMAIGALTGLSAGVAALTSGSVDPVAFAIVCPITLIGAFLGSHRTAKLDRANVRRWIGYVLVPTGVLMVLDVAATSTARRHFARASARSVAAMTVVR
jgi:uncharacterized membrane protein YfcA